MCKCWYKLCSFVKSKFYSEDDTRDAKSYLEKRFQQLRIEVQDIIDIKKKNDNSYTCPQSII